MVDVRALVTVLGSALAPIETVRVAYVFGSRLRGQARPGSDLDLAVVFDSDLDASGREVARRDVLDAMARTKELVDVMIDVVDLRRTDSAVAFTAVREGVVVLARTKDERVENEVFVARSYDDDSYKRRLFEDAARRVAAGWARG